MEIDLFTFVIQIFNFLLLVVLLRLVLYKPIINAMNEREAKIAQRLKEAEEKRAEAEAEAEAYRQQRAELAERREALIDEAKNEAAARREELLSKARADAEAARQRWQQALEQEKTMFLRELRQRSGEQVLAIARRVLSEMADAELEERIVNIFIARLRALEDGDLAALRETASQAGETLVIRSAFPLDDDQKAALIEAVREAIGTGSEPQFTVAEGLIGGIELRIEGHEVRWSIASYLAELEKDVLRLLQANGAPT